LKTFETGADVDYFTPVETGRRKSLNFAGRLDQYSNRDGINKDGGEYLLLADHCGNNDATLRECTRSMIFRIFLRAAFLVLIAIASMESLSVSAFAGNRHLGRPEVGRMNPDPNKKTLHRREIVVIGASYAKGWPLSGIGDIKFLNRGVSGEQTSEMLSRFNRDVVSRKPDMVIIWGFINDIFRSAREDIEPKLMETRKNIETMIRTAEENGIRPILATEVTIRGKDEYRESVAAWIGKLIGKQSYQDYVNRNVIETNRWIREMAGQRNLPLLDLQPLLSDSDGVRKKEYATPDGSHISSLGYDVLTRYAEKVLAGL